MNAKEAIILTLESDIRCSEQTLREFAERLVSRPDTFGNCDSTMGHGARLYVSRMAIKWLQREDFTLDTLIAHATKAALHEARFPTRSTSITSNCWEQLVASSWAHLAETAARAGI